MTTPDPILPWYKYFWPWFLIAIPTITVIVGIDMFSVANRSFDGMVVDDYYKTGLAINMTLARDRQAEKLGLQAIGRIDQASKQVIITLHGQNTAENLRLTLTHPTSSQQDIAINLTAGDKNNQYTGQLPQLPHEKRYILLEPVDQSWRLTGHAMFPGMIQWSLRPGL